MRVFSGLLLVCWCNFLIGLLIFVREAHGQCQDLVPTCGDSRGYCKFPSLVRTFYINCRRTCGYCPEGVGGRKKQSRRRRRSRSSTKKTSGVPKLKYPKYKLTYFDIRFQAEPVRLAFHYCNRSSEFEDVRLTETEWIARKAIDSEAELPLLEVDGKKIVNPMIIYRFIGRRLGLFGSNEMESVHLDYVSELWREFVDATLHYKRVVNGDEPGDELAIHDDEFDPALQKYASIIETFLIKKDSGYFGNSVSWVDFYVAGTVQTFNIIDPTSMSAYPILLDHNERIYSLPQLSSYINKDGQTESAI